MEIAHLRHFYAVAKHGSFTKAAKALRVSQPSISKTVKMIEQSEGILLFDRGTRFVKLTEAGRRFLAGCETIFQEFENLHRISEFHREDVAGTASFGASDNLCNYLLPPLLAAFRKKHTAVELRLHSGTASAIEAELLAGTADFGLYYTPVQESSLESRRIKHVEFVVVAKRGVGTLESLGYIGSRQSDYSKPYPALRMLSSLGVKPKLVLETNSQETQKQLALEGLGYSVLPRFMVERELKAKTLVRIGTGKLIGSDLFLVKKKNRALPRPAQTLAEFIEKALT